ncbi:energy-coupling factor ABC transporter ATP-binding protein [Geodermatophilus sp. FMUSA9-8]|uniref:energy-coupling factor ABC transporter ATP-binding protein n=1 Tax=Geodermatophilus sp. FMUSA9-8 TaxID=3120155 RepID=UPI00300A569F
MRFRRPGTAGAPAAADVADPGRGIELRGVGHRYGERVVLDGIDLTLTEARVGVVGANGSGKSTFARLLNGLVLPTSGSVTVDGLDTRTQVRAVRRRVGFVFQDPDAQIVHPTVAEDVAYGLENQGVPPAERSARVAEVLERYGLAGHADHPAHLLSGGQKQLLAIAGVLVMRPARIVFDEPTTLLDLVNTRRVAELIAGLEQQVVVVTHQLDLLDGFDRVLVVDGGRVVEDASPGPAVAAYRALMAGR